MKFFIPHLKNDPEAAEAEWQRYLSAGGGASPRRVYSMEYEHGGSKFAVTVGEERQEWTRQRGPRGGYIKNADLVRHPIRTGTVVSGIVDAGLVLYVWSYGPPFGGWGNPSLVGSGEVRRVEHFEDSP